MIRIGWTAASAASVVLVCALAPAQGQQMCNTCSVPSVGGSETAKAEDPRWEELKRLDVELDNAKLRGDKAAVTTALAEGMIEVGASGDVTEREKVLARVRASSPALKMSISAADAQVKLFGDTAIVTSKKTRRWERNGRPDSMDYRETNTYVRRDGRWLRISSQHSEEPPPYSAKDVAFDLPFNETLAFGDKNAPIVIFEFSDYECPFCRRFAAETLSRVEKEYIRTGRAALVFRDYPLEASHPRAFAAAIASQCAASAGKFKEMNERLMQDPVELSDEALAHDAREIGIDPAAFGRCVGDPATAQKIRAGMSEADRLGIRGTPVFVIGARKTGETTVHALRMIEGAYPYEVFQATLDGALRARLP
jgi:protein-disulfide isomerase